jgi:hypothetical protein
MLMSTRVPGGWLYPLLVSARAVVPARAVILAGAVVLAGGVVLAGCGSAPAPRSSGAASPAATASGSGTAACFASGLRVRLDAAAAGVAAGSYYVPLEFTNTSGRACRLAGYPAVAFASGAAGEQIGAVAAVDRSVRANAVLLSPGGVAHAWLQVVNAANYPASKCHPVTAAGLRVAAPGTASASYLAHPVAACRTAIQGSEILTIHPVQGGRARRGTAQ